MNEHLPKKIILLGWVSFFADISTEMIYPLMPIFVVGLLGSQPVVLGLIEGVAQALVSLLPILGKALITIAGSWQVVLLGRSIDREWARG